MYVFQLLQFLISIDEFRVIQVLSSSLTRPHMMRSTFLAVPCRSKVTERVIYVQWASVAELPSRHRNAGISGYRVLSKVTHRAVRVSSILSDDR